MAFPSHEGKVAKILQNGQLFIIRDGIVYNAIGQTIQ